MNILTWLRMWREYIEFKKKGELSFETKP